MTHTRRIAAVATTLVLLAAVGAVAAEKVVPQPAPTRHVDLVICLDTSGSMSGLIESAKQKLWAVVNELATARPRPRLRVALYHYGNTGLKAKTGWVQQLCPLTDDLDAVYGKLFPLRTNGGTEYVARVTRAAVQELDWNREKGTLRMIFVAGNEPATQDPVYKLQDICKAAATNGIIVNTIHCGSVKTGRQTGWADAARWADGQYAAIDQNRGTVVINTPHDKKLLVLNEELNKTYLSYGQAGRKRQENQIAQDKNARKVNAPAAAQRTVAKATSLYNNASWDLVDASKEKDFKLGEVKAEHLPESMRKMSLDERKAYIAKHAARRAELQKQIRLLSQQREAVVKKEMARKGLKGNTAFDTALRAAVRTQAKRLNFTFEKTPAK